MLDMLKERKAALEAQGQKGFTLMEMLIVIAIIAILIAIAIPIFSGQLENAREATDAANIRSAYAEAATHALSDANEDFTATVDKQQAQADWQNTSLGTELIGGIAVNSLNSNTPTTITYTAANSSDTNAGKIMIDGQEAVTSFETQTQP